VSARAAQLEDGWSPNELCEGEQSHAYIISHPISTQLTSCDGIHSHQVQWHYYVYDSVSARAAQLEDGWSPNELCEGEQSHAYIIKHPIETQLTPCDGIHSHQVQWHYYVYWFCECQSSTTGGQMVSKWMCEGEQSHAYIIKHQSQHNWLLVMEYTDISTVTFLRVLILWVPELENWGWMVSKWIVWGEQSHAYIIKHPIETQLTSCNGIHWHQVQWHSYVYWFCECQSSTTGGPMVSKWIVWGEQSHAYIIKHQLKHNWLLVMEYTHIRYSDITTCIDSVSAQSSTTGGRMVSKWIVWGRAVSCLHNQAPIETQLTSCNGIHWHQVQWHYYVYWFCECQSWRTGGRMVSK